MLHPAALDAVFQAVAGLSAGSSLRIPAGARRVVRLGDLGGRLRVITTGRPEDAAIWALNEDGQLVLYVEGFSLRAPPGVRAFAPVWTPIDVEEPQHRGLDLHVSADDTAGLIQEVFGLRRAGRFCRSQGAFATPRRQQGGRAARRYLQRQPGFSTGRD